MMPEEEKQVKQERMILELMSGSRFRLPFLVMITIDDPADLITLLGLDGGHTAECASRHREFEDDACGGECDCGYEQAKERWE